MSDKKHALSVLTAGKFAPQCNFDRAGKALNEQLRLIRNADTEFAMRAVYVGTALLMVKESLEHGQFGPWLDKNIDDLGRRQVAYYMKLALVALEAQRVSTKALEAVSVNDIDAALAVSKGPAAEFKSAVEKFVGDASLSDLLAEHCGKTKGGKKTKRPANGAGDDEEGDDTVAEKTPQDLCNEIEEYLKLARATATDPAIWMRLSKKQHEALKAAFAAAADRVGGLYVKTHGRKAD